MIKMRFQKKLFLSSLFLTFFTLLIFCSIFLYVAAQDFAANENLRLEQKSVEAAGILGKTLELHMASVRAVGNNAQIKSNVLGADISGVLETIKSANPVYSELMIADSDGTVTASAGDISSYRFLNDKQFLASLSGKTLVSDVRKEGENRFYFWIFSPLSEAGGIVHSVVAAKIPLRVVWDVTDNMKFEDFGFVFVSDASGRLIAHQDKKSILSAMPYDFKYGTTNVGGIADSDGVIAGYSGFPEASESLPGWKVFAALPKEVVQSDLNSIKNGFMLAAIISFFISLVAAYIVTKRTAKPLVSMNKEIKEVLAGSRDYGFFPRTGDEVEDISDAFSRILKVLRDKDLLERIKSNLEEKVQEQEKINKLLVGRENEIVKMKRKVAKSKNQKV